MVFALEGFGISKIEDTNLSPDLSTLFVGLNGVDHIKGSSGADLILAGTGNDEILTSGGGVYIIHGGAGDDIFFADFGGDHFTGGANSDTINYTLHDQYEILNGPSGLGIRIVANLKDGVVERSLISGGSK